MLLAALTFLVIVSLAAFLGVMSIDLAVILFLSGLILIVMGVLFDGRTVRI